MRTSNLIGPALDWAVAKCEGANEAWNAGVEWQKTQPPAVAAPTVPVDYCTDPDNCARCKTHPNHRGAMQHAGIGKHPWDAPVQEVPTPSPSEEKRLESLKQALIEECSIRETSMGEYKHLAVLGTSIIRKLISENA